MNMEKAKAKTPSECAMRRKLTTEKRKIGRRTIITAALTEKLTAHVADCNTIATSAQACGVSPRSVYNWIQRGENGEEPFAHFARSIAHARGAAKQKLVKVLVDASASDWRCAAWLLARREESESLLQDNAPPSAPPVQPIFTTVWQYSGESEPPRE